MAFTKVTNVVIAANTIVGSLIANSAIALRHVSSEVLNLSPANAYNTWQTLLANDFGTYANVTANLFNTYTALNANVGGTGTIPIRWANTNTSTATSNVFFIGSPKTPNLTSNVSVYISGIYQPSAEWVFHTTNNTVQIKDASLPAGLTIDLAVWHLP